jgi:hypothetical protein
MPFRAPFLKACERFAENSVVVVELIYLAVILLFYTKPSYRILAQPLPKRLPASDRVYPKIPRRRGGKRHTMLMMFVGGVVLVIDGIPVLFLQ